MRPSQRRQQDAMIARRAGRGEPKGVSVPKPLILIWAVIWPLIGFAFSAVGNELTSRLVPGVIDVASDKAGIGPINIRHDWPGDYCQEGATAAVYPAPAPAPARIIERVDPLHFAFDSGAYAHQFGLLRVFVTAQPTVTVVVEGIDVVKFADEDKPLVWAMGVDPQCGAGETDVRVYTLAVDAAQPQLRLIAVNDEAKDELAFSPFEASASDPAILLINAKSCRDTQHWGLKIRYSVNGHPYEASIGTDEDPLRISGKSLDRSTIAFYNEGDGFKLVNSQQLPSVCE